MDSSRETEDLKRIKKIEKDKIKNKNVTENIIYNI